MTDVAHHHTGSLMFVAIVNDDLYEVKCVVIVLNKLL